MSFKSPAAVAIDPAVAANTAKDSAFSMAPATGLVSGGKVTVAGSLTVDVEAGTGFVNNNDAVNPSVVPVAWSAVFGLALTADALNRIFVDSAGVVTATSGAAAHSVNVVLSEVVTTATDIAFIAQHFTDPLNVAVDKHSYALKIVGPIFVTGCAATINGGNALRLDVDGGEYFISDVQRLPTVTAPATFTYWYRDGSGGHTKVIGATEIDPNFYDDGSGTLAALGAGLYKKDVLYIATDGANTPNYHVVYGQETFASQVAAESGAVPSPAAVLRVFSLRSTSVVILEGAAAIASVQDARPVLGQLGAAVTAAADHGALSGLPDDDHGRYVDKTGDATRNAITGTLNVSGPLLWTNEVIEPQFTTLTGNDDIGPVGIANANVLYVSSNGVDFEMTGIVAPSPPTARVLVVVSTNTEASGNKIVMKVNSASSAAANRFLIDGDRDIKPEQGVLLRYDVTASRWRLVARA